MLVLPGYMPSLPEYWQKNTAPPSLVTRKNTEFLSIYRLASSSMFSIFIPASAITVPGPKMPITPASYRN
jgi:hypothetical protein